LIVLDIWGPGNPYQGPEHQLSTLHMAQSHPYQGVQKPSFDLQSFPPCQLPTMISSAGESLAQKGIAGNISSIFERKVQGDAHPRFSELKKAIWKESMEQSWTQVLDALKEKVEQIGSVGSKVGSSTRDPLVCAKAIIL